VRTAQELSTGSPLPVEAWINLESTDLAAGCRALTSGRGADVVLDTVGGAMFEPCLAALAHRGRQVAITSGVPRVGINLVDFYHNESRLVGVDSVKCGFAEAAQIMRDLVPAFESGELSPLEVTTAPLENGPEIYRQIGAGTVRGKVVLVP
jgi:NADPH:quinone reductase